MKRYIDVLKECLGTIYSGCPLKVFFLLFALYAVGWYWGLPSEFDADADAPVPYSPLAFVSDYFNPQIAEKYPATHQILLLPFYGIYLVLMKLKGDVQSISPIWPHGFRNPSEVFSALIVISRVISTFMAVSIIFCLRKFHWKEFDRSSQYVAMVLMAGNGVFTYYARAGNFDVPYLFWWALSLVYLSIYIFESSSGIKPLIISAIFSALSIGTKDQAAGLVLGSGLIILLVHSETTRTLVVRFRHALAFTTVTLFVYIIVAVLPQPVRWMNHVGFWGGFVASGVTDYIQYESSWRGHLGLLRESAYRLSHIISPVGILFSVIGMIILIKSGRYRIVAFLSIPIISYYALIIFNIRFVLERYLLPIAFLLVISAGIGVGVILQYLKGKNRIIYFVANFAVILVLAYHAISGYFPITYAQIFDIKRALAESIPSHVARGSIILWCGKEANFPNTLVYENYKLSLPPGERPWSKRAEHVFVPYEPDFAYILSDSHQLFEQKDANLIQIWRYPDWINNSLHVRLTNEYYLYKKIRGRR